MVVALGLTVIALYWYFWGGRRGQGDRQRNARETTDEMSGYFDNTQVSKTLLCRVRKIRFGEVDEYDQNYCVRLSSFALDLPYNNL